MGAFVIISAYDSPVEDSPRKPDKDLRWEVVGTTHPVYVGVSVPHTYEDEKVARLVARALARETSHRRYKAVATIHTDRNLDTEGGAEVSA